MSVPQSGPACRAVRRCNSAPKKRKEKTIQIKHINIEDLKPSPLNVRKHGCEDVSDLLPSIRSLGVIQSLLVRPNCEGYEVVAGGRRFRAAQLIAAEGCTIDPLPCIVLAEGEDAKAVEASLAENIARLPMDEIDQYEAFATLKKQGRTIEDIGAHFGVTERLVTQRLAIANLHPPILSAYRKGGIEPASLRALTMAGKARQKEWFKLYRNPETEEPTGRWLKAWLLGGSEIPVSHALFPLDAYGGKIISDLFEDGQFFDDGDAFWALQMAAVQERQQAYLDTGWADAVICENTDYWSRYDKVKRGKKEGGKVFIQCRPNGEVVFHEGWLDEKEAKRLDRAAAKANGEVVSAPKPELTKAAIRYHELHRHNAVRVELLKHSQIALRLAVAHMIAGSGLWDVRPEPQNTGSNEAITQSIEASKAQLAFAKERDAVAGLLEQTTTSDLAATFARLLKLGDKDVMRVLAFAMSDTLEAGTPVVEALGHGLKVDMAAWWQPDETFFDLLRDKPAINAMLAEVAGKRTAKNCAAKTAKAQKDTIKAHLEGGNSAKQPEHWLPRTMRFPMQGYTKRKGLPPVEQWKAVKKLFVTTT